MKRILPLGSYAEHLCAPARIEGGARLSIIRPILAALALALLALPAEAPAQALYGSIAGNVTDPSGAAIPGANVEVTNIGTNQSRETVTNTAGVYSLARLEVGLYSVRVSAEGFRTRMATNVRVSVNNAVRVNADLVVGVVAETITVAAEAARLQTEQSEVRYEVSSAELENLPIPVGRNYQNQLRMLPGVTVSGGGAFTNTPHFGNPGSNVSNMSLNAVGD